MHSAAVAKKLLRLVTLPLAAIALASLGACGGAVDKSLDEDLVINEQNAALTSGDAPSAPDADPERKGDEDRDCRDGDRHQHKHHFQHKLKVLDGLDGVRDNAITIAALPPGLPKRLIDKLHEIDANHDGVVTRDEVKAALHDFGRHEGKHDKHGHGHDGDHDDDRDGDHGGDHDGDHDGDHGGDHDGDRDGDHDRR
jgi:hypothetical protein